MRTKITLTELGSFLGVSASTVKSVHADGETAFIEVEVYAYEEIVNGPKVEHKRIINHRGDPATNTYRIALVN